MTRKESEMRDPVVTMLNALALQACVPGEWTDDQVLELCEATFAANAFAGWRVKSRVQCAERDGFAHVLVTV